MNNMAVCDVCFRHCELSEGQTGFCGARTMTEGRIKASNYGLATALALDPIEKKPLHRFYPGSRILSVGSYGCNLRCPFCQNYQISWSEEVKRAKEEAERISPEELADTAAYYQPKGNIGVAFTYNEPLVGYEYVLDAAKLVHERGMKNVLVTNGTAELAILERILPYMDAMNIDLKGFSDRYYKELLGGDLEMVKAFIKRAVQSCHVELTTLIIPGENDSVEEMRQLSGWIAGLSDVYGGKPASEIPLHISRFFPRFHMTDKPPTDVAQIKTLVKTAKERLQFVYRGNC